MNASIGNLFVIFLNEDLKCQIFGNEIQYFFLIKTCWCIGNQKNNEK